MNILLLSRYGRLGASSRIRSYQYLPYLENNGIDITVSPLLDSSYIEKLYSTGQRDKTTIFSSYLNRVRKLLQLKDYDGIWVEKEFLPWLPAFVSRLLKYTGISYLVDYDDSVFHRYDNHSHKLVRTLLGSKIDTIMAAADVVTVGNEYLAQRARRAGSNRIEFLPTVVDLSRYEISDDNGGPFTIGWIGTPNTARYLNVVRPALKEFANQNTVKLILVGSGNIEIEGVDVEVRSWSEETEVSDITDFDVGIMPLYDGPIERGKCGYKLIQYMACGLPVVASPVGVNRQIVESNNGYLVDSTDEWVDALSTLREDPSLRMEMGWNGRHKVEENFCLEATAPKLLSILQSL